MADEETKLIHDRDIIDMITDNRSTIMLVNI